MPSSQRWFARGLDVLAVVIVLFALWQFFVAPRLAANRIVPAPPVDIATLTDKRFDLARHRGRIVFLDFWASWCEPCKQSIPLIQAYARKHPEVDVVSVDVGEPESVVRSFARTHPMSDIALDPDEIVAHAFGIVNFPTMVVIDPAGNERAKWVGLNPAVSDAMATTVSELRRN